MVLGSVRRAEWLVHQQHARVVGQRGALLHAARQLLWVVVGGCARRGRRAPLMVAGTDRFDTRKMQGLGDRVFCKGGAGSLEGHHAIAS